VASLLEDEGIHVTYGAMSRQKVSVPNRFLIFQNLTFTGFWLSRWMKRASAEKISLLYELLAQHVLTGSLQLPIAQTFPVEEITAAVTAAQMSQRSGKILLSWS
jgi:trans-2-enoyl-CoA reductase